MKNLKKYTFNEPFVTEGGDHLAKPMVSYQTWGELNQNRDNAVLVCHALTGNTATDEWFSVLFGRGKLFDSSQHFIICTNVLGSCYGTTGPANINLESGEPYRIDFPKIAIRDIVRLHIVRNRSEYEVTLEQMHILIQVIGTNSDRLYPVYEQHELGRISWPMHITENFIRNMATMPFSLNLTK